MALYMKTVLNIAVLFTENVEAHGTLYEDCVEYSSIIY